MVSDRDASADVDQRLRVPVRPDQPLGCSVRRGRGNMEGLDPRVGDALLAHRSALRGQVERRHQGRRRHSAAAHDHQGPVRPADRARRRVGHPLPGVAARAVLHHLDRRPEAVGHGHDALRADRLLPRQDDTALSRTGQAVVQSMSKRWWPAMTAPVLDVVCYGEVHRPFGNAQNATVIATFAVDRGQVTITTGNAIRRTCSQVRLVPYPFTRTNPPVPVTSKSPLFAAGNEIWLYKGVRYSTGQEEVALLGKFLMTDVVTYFDTRTGTLYIMLNGTDRAGTIGREKFTEPYSTTGVQALNVVVPAMITHQMGSGVVVFNDQPGET